MKGAYNAEEVAEMMGVHVRTIRRHIKAGDLPAKKIGKSYVITRPDLARYLGSDERAAAVLKAYDRAA